MNSRYVLLWVKDDDRAQRIYERYHEKPGVAVLGVYPAPSTWCYCPLPRLVRYAPTRDHLVDYCTQCGGARLGFDAPANLLFAETAFPERDRRPGTVVQFSCYFDSDRELAAGRAKKSFPELPLSSVSLVGHDRRQLPGKSVVAETPRKKRVVRRKRRA